MTTAKGFCGAIFDGDGVRPPAASDRAASLTRVAVEISAGGELLTAGFRSVVPHGVAPGATAQRRSPLAAEVVTDYRELGSILRMPVGSIGPTRARELANLERHVDLRALAAVS